MPAVEAVIFDIGNVLIEWQPERYFDRIVGQERRKALFSAVDLHAMNDRVDRGENFHDVLAETGAAYPEFAEEIKIWHDRWIELAAPVIPASVHLLRALQSRGVPVFALTNFGIQTFEIAEAHYDFLKEFDRRFISGRMGVIKPDPTIYAMVEAESGVAPGALLFADDRADNIAAADARGWKTHLFDGPEGWARRLVAEELLTASDVRI